MPNTVPNQRVVAIHRVPPKSDFLGIKNENWQAASRDLGAQALMLYLYLASNADGYTLALSPSAIRQTVGMPPSTYRDQFVKLIDKGYLVQRGEGNTYDFYETPQRATCAENESTVDDFDLAANVQQETKSVQNGAGVDIEINKYNTNSIINMDVEKQVSPTPKSKFKF